MTEGAVVVLNNDPVNQLRGLRVLESAGLLNGLVDGDSALSVQDDAARARRRRLRGSQLEQVPKFYQEDPTVGMAIVDGNYIVQAKLNKDEVLAQESAENNPNADS